MCTLMNFNFFHILVWVLAVMAIVTNSIGISCIQDPKKDTEKFLIINLVANILLMLFFSYIVYRDFTSNTF